MKQKVKNNNLKKWRALLLGLWMALTTLVIGCNTNTEAVSLEEMLVLEQRNDEEQSVAPQVTEAEGANRTADRLLQTVWVHICGEVENPGIYELHVESRVYDVVVLAGGFTAEADTTYYNLASKVSDGMKLEVPARSEKKEMSFGEGGFAERGSNSGDISAVGLNTNDVDNGLVNINTATSEQLQSLPGIGESRAADIIVYREEHGGFKSTEEIMKVSGIKEAVYAKIKELITVE